MCCYVALRNIFLLICKNTIDHLTLKLIKGWAVMGYVNCCIKVYIAGYG